MNDKGPRPFGVTIVFLVIIITGLYSIVLGVLRLFDRDETGLSIAAALSMIVIGLIYVLVARGIARGGRGSRFLVSIVALLSIISALWVWISSIGHNLWLTALVQILLSLIVLALLYTQRARMYFAR
jgi:drug/metabolite transporter (DMT)-like permease